MIDQETQFSVEKVSRRLRVAVQKAEEAKRRKTSITASTLLGIILIAASALTIFNQIEVLRSVYGTGGLDSDKFSIDVAFVAFYIIGLASLSVTLYIALCGLKLTNTFGKGIPWSRAIFFPTVAAMTSIFFAFLPQPKSWPFSFGMGGLFGDMIVTFLFDLAGLTSQRFAIFMMFLAALSTLGGWIYLLGIDKFEINNLKQINLGKRMISTQSMRDCIGLTAFAFIVVLLVISAYFAHRVPG